MPGHIVFVDDEPGVRRVVRRTLERIGATVHCYDSADDCLARMDSVPCDVLVSDVMMPGKDGIELLIEVKKRQPWLPVLVVTAFGDIPMAVRAMRAGASDFIEKPLDREAFVRTVEVLVKGSPGRRTAVKYDLTPAEMGILHLLLEGKNNREMAATLHRSPRTVEVHRSHVMRKMGADNIVQLVRRATDLGPLDWHSGYPG